MKVLLIQPPIEDYYDTSIRTYPLSLLYIATKVREICDVSIADLRSNRKPRQIIDHPFPELAPYYRKDRYTPISLFKQYSRFGADLGEIRQRIVFEKPAEVIAGGYYTTEINMENLANGVYVVNLVTEQDKISSKIGKY